MIQNLDEDEKDDRVVSITQESKQALWEELTDRTNDFRTFASRPSSFTNMAHKFMHLVLTRYVCGHYDSTGVMTHPDILCLYGMIRC